MLFYRNKLRPLRVRTLENFVKIVQVDDSRSVAEVTRTVCSKIGNLAIDLVNLWRLLCMYRTKTPPKLLKTPRNC